MEYKTTFNGEINLDKVQCNHLNKIEEKVDSYFAGLMSVDRDTQTLYISGDIDNTNDGVQLFLKKILPVLHLTENVTIEAQGQSPEDRWDIIVTPEDVFIQDYVLVKNGPPKKVD